MRPLFLGELALAGGIALQAGRNASLLGGSALAVGFVATVYALGALAGCSGARLGSRLADSPVVLPISGSLLRGLSSIGNGFSFRNAFSRASDACNSAASAS
jgi:hypothetical protein